jgi:hypothetical protein
MFGLRPGELLPPRPSFIGAVKTLPKREIGLGVAEAKKFSKLSD